MSLCLGLGLGLQAALAQTGPVGRWTFDRTNVAGAVLQPSAGQLPGEINGPIAWSGDPDALVLDGATGWVSLAAAMDTRLLPAQDLTAEAWVALRAPAEWGGIVGCIQDNGAFEKGWLLGYRQQSFSMAVAAVGTLTYLASPSGFSLNKWYHVVGTYDGSNLRLYVNGQQAVSSTAQHGPIQYAPAPYVLGAYKDDNEFYGLNGYLREVCVYDRALSAQEVLARYNARKGLFPASIQPPGPGGTNLPPALGPYVQFTGPATARVHWLTAGNSASALEYGPTLSLGTAVVDTNLTAVHALDMQGLQAKTRYFYRVRHTVGGQEVSSEIYDLETDFNYSVPPVAGPSPFPNEAESASWAQAAEGILAQSGQTKGYCLDLGCGEGRLAYELARRSELHVVGVSSRAEDVAAARRRLLEAGVYGSRVTVFECPPGPLPFASNSFNLVVSSAVLAGGDPPVAAAVLGRTLRPAGGRAVLGLPSGMAGTLTNYDAVRAWAASAFPPDRATVLPDAGRGVTVQSLPLSGAGEWSHAYGDPGQSGSSQDRRIAGTGMRLRWFGEPGPRGLLDRQPRAQPPLVANGVLFVEGNNRITAQDAYNGKILWSLEVPNLRRVNLPRDTGNLCADDRSLFAAVRDSCWRLGAYTGSLLQHYAVRTPGGTAGCDWGLLIQNAGRLYGSSVRQGAAYTAFDGGTYWYDSRGVESTGKVCSENLFCLGTENGQLAWSYARGIIINSTVALGGGRVYFVESRNPALVGLGEGRIVSSDLYQQLYLVALDAATGAPLWEQALSLPSSPVPVVLFLCYAEERLVLLDSTSRFYLYGYSAKTGQGTWEKNHAWLRDNHGSHMYHPVIARGTVFVEPYGYNLETGVVAYSNLPGRGGCSTISAAGNVVHYINWDYDNGAIYLWDLNTGQRTELAGPRASCWLSLVSGGGMLLLPPVSAGCTCRFPLQTSLGFAAP